MTRAREIAEQAVNNVWLTLAQRVVTLIGVPIAIMAGASYMALRDRVTLAEADLRTAQQRLTSQETATAGLRAELAVQSGAVTRLQAQREGDAQIGRRLDDFREDIQRVTGDLRGDIQRVNSRLDAMMTPPRRLTP